MTACRPDAFQARSRSARTRVSTGKQRERARGAQGEVLGMDYLLRESVSHSAPNLKLLHCSHTWPDGLKSSVKKLPTV